MHRGVTEYLDQPDRFDLVSRCSDNTLDVTVQRGPDGRTFITDDLRALGLWGSAAQVWHYLPRLSGDDAPHSLIADLIHRQADASRPICTPTAPLPRPAAWGTPPT